MSQEQAPNPYFVTRVEIYVDSHGRRITRLAPASGVPTADFIEFIGEGELPCTHDGKTFKVPARFPIEGVRTKGDRLEEALGKAFGRYDEAAAAHQEECQKQFDDHVARQQAEAARQAQQAQEGVPLRSILEKPLHDPTLAERHVNEEGQTIQKPQKASSIIVP